MFSLALYLSLLVELLALSALPIPGSALFTSLPTKCPSPPCVCSHTQSYTTASPYDNRPRKTVRCLSDRLNQIPIDKMDPDTEVLNVTAPLGSYNTITLGRFFESLAELSELHITRSRLPAIGDYTFCPIFSSSGHSCGYAGCPSKIRILNLSHNSLQSLRDKELYCLENLKLLDLSHNHIRNLPSATFKMLKSLTHLDLSHNHLEEFPPSMFLNLSSLLELDLSHNLFQYIDVKAFVNTPALTKLKLNSCQLFKLDSAVFHVLTRLDHLDLSHNQLNALNATAFQDLGSLRTLKLSSNRITVLPDKLFAGLKLESLNLSANLINPLKGCPFCGSAIRVLDLSHNPINSFSSLSLEPLGKSLQTLIMNHNRKLIDPHSSLVGVLHPLQRLRHLSIVGWKLNESLPETVFDNHRTLIDLNISHNDLHDLSARLLSPLTNMVNLDVSHNQLNYLDPSTFEVLSRMRHLAKLYLAGNPFSCYRCHILPMIEWLAVSDPHMAYWNVCDRLSQDSEALQLCAQCATPTSLRGRYLHEPNLSQELEWCTNPEVQLRLTASEPQVGLILAFLIIVSLIAVILVVVAIYRKHGAVYYTQEDKYPSTEKIYHENVGRSTQFISRQTTFTSPNSSLDAGHSISAPAQAPPTILTPTSSAPPPNPASGVCNDCASSPQVKQMLASIPAMTEMLEQSLNAAVKSGAMSGRVAPPPSAFKVGGAHHHQVGVALSANDLAQSHGKWNQSPPERPNNSRQQSPSPERASHGPEITTANLIQASPSSLGRNSPHEAISTSDVHIYI